MLGSNSSETETGPTKMNDEEVPPTDGADSGSSVDRPTELISSSFTSPSPRNVQRGFPPREDLSEVSAMFDRHGKGYLDDTERALRRMDTQNNGFLDVTKVYNIMESLQLQQKQNAKLLETLQREQHRSLNLKRGIMALCVFALMLALANIGTSFAAAKLAQETSVNTQGDLTNMGGQRVGTTSKVIEFEVYPISNDESDNGRRRMLRERELQICGELQADSNVTCALSGELDGNDAVELYQQFCPLYDGVNVLNCQGQHAEKILFHCNGKTSTILGDETLPRGGPESWDGYLVFPSRQRGFSATQNDPRVVGRQLSQDCSQPFSFSMYCFEDNDNASCLLFNSWQPSCPNNGAIAVCGDPSYNRNRNKMSNSAK